MGPLPDPAEILAESYAAAARRGTEEYLDRRTSLMVFLLLLPPASICYQNITLTKKIHRVGPQPYAYFEHYRGARPCLIPLVSPPDVQMLGAISGFMDNIEPEEVTIRLKVSRRKAYELVAQDSRRIAKALSLPDMGPSYVHQLWRLRWAELSAAHYDSSFIRRYCQPGAKLAGVQGGIALNLADVQRDDAITTTGRYWSAYR